MLRPVTPQDAPQALEWLCADPRPNRYLADVIARVHKGLNAWWLLDREGNRQGLLGFHLNTYYLYAPEDYDAAGAATLIGASLHPPIVGGEKHAIHLLEPYLASPRMEKRFHYALLDREPNPSAPCDRQIREAIPADAGTIYRMRQEIWEFGPSMPLKDMHRMLASGENHTFFIANDRGNAIASATLTARSAYGAVVVSVMTHPAYRGLGLASVLTHHISKRVTDNGGKLILFFDNPIAGHIYEKLGYRVDGQWRFLYL